MQKDILFQMLEQTNLLGQFFGYKIEVAGARPGQIALAIVKGKSIY